MSIEKFEEECLKQENELRNLESLILDTTVDDKDLELSLEDWIKRLILFYNKNFNTITNSGYIIVQTDKDMHRSTQDLYRITVTYKPEITLLDFILSLYTLAKANTISLLYCGNIENMTWFPTGSREYYNSLQKLGGMYLIERNKLVFGTIYGADLKQYYEEKNEVHLAV